MKNTKKRKRKSYQKSIEVLRRKYSNILKMYFSRDCTVLSDGEVQELLEDVVLRVFKGRVQWV